MSAVHYDIACSTMERAAAIAAPIPAILPRSAIVLPEVLMRHMRACSTMWHHMLGRAVLIAVSICIILSVCLLLPLPEARLRVCTLQYIVPRHVVASSTLAQGCIACLAQLLPALRCSAASSVLQLQMLG